jgi:Rrf2 family protein
MALGMLNLTSEYALRAMIYVAQHFEEQPILGRRIAEQTGIPAKYLSKVLGDLVRVGVLDSSRGRGGGFRMMRSPKDVPLADVLAPFGVSQQRRCPFGNALCSEDQACTAHEQWKKVLAAQERFLRDVSLAAVATEQPRAKRSGVQDGKRRPRRSGK